VIWDNGPAPHGPEIRAYLRTSDLNLRPVALPGCSPDFNPAEVIWAWIREDVTANTCFGTADKVPEKVDAFFAGLAERTGEVQQRCLRDLQAQADAPVEAASQLFAQNEHVDLTLESVY
jgi:transposase